MIIFSVYQDEFRARLCNYRHESRESPEGSVKTFAAESRDERAKERVVVIAPRRGSKKHTDIVLQRNIVFIIHTTYMVRLQALRSPDSRGAGVVSEHVEHPGLVLVNYGERLASLAGGAISATPIGGIETQLSGEVSHHLDGLASAGGALQSDLGHLSHLNSSHTASSHRNSPEPGSTSTLSDGHLVLIHDGIATFEKSKRMSDLGDVTTYGRFGTPCRLLLFITLKVIRMPSGSTINTDNAGVLIFVHIQWTQSSFGPIASRHLLKTKINT